MDQVMDRKNWWTDGWGIKSLEFLVKWGMEKMDLISIFGGDSCRYDASNVYDAK